MRQEIEARAGQPLAPLACQHDVESAAQRVQMKHVRSGITKLLFGQGLRSPVGALLLFRQIGIQQVLAQIAQPVPIGKRPRQARSDFRAIDRQRHDADIMIDHGEVEPREVEQLGHTGIASRSLSLGAEYSPGANCTRWASPSPADNWTRHSLSRCGLRPIASVSTATTELKWTPSGRSP